MAKENSKIGTVQAPIPPDAGLKPEIEVIFKQDAEQALNVIVRVEGIEYTECLTTL